MSKLTVNERLAQLISEKNMGVKASSVNNDTRIVVEAPKTTKTTKTDSLEISNKNIDPSKKSIKDTESQINTKVVPEENPFIHNQVVDNIAKKMLRAFIG